MKFLNPKTDFAFKKIFGIWCLIFIITFHTNAQSTKRIEGEFSIKKASPGDKSLTMGKFYYDLNSQKLVYQVDFPQKKTIVIKDSLSFIFDNGLLVKTEPTLMQPQFTIFYMALSGQLADFGMKRSGYINTQTKYDKGLLITEWQPPSGFEEQFGKIIISQKNKTLFGMLYYNTSDKLFNRQLYKNYVNYDGFMFPGEVINIFYLKNDETVNQLTTFKNVKVNNFQTNDAFYNYILPD